MKNLYKKFIAAACTLFMLLSTADVVCCALSAPVAPTAAYPEIVSETAIVINADTGQVLYDKNSDKVMYPASITKILTALVALEDGDLSSTITMSHEAVFGIEAGSSHIALDEGEQINFEDAMYAVMLVSANEAAWGVAEHVGGTLSGFCDMMNKRAKELGCQNTNFVNANGLHDDNHYTTAYDMALITQEAIKNEEFLKLTSTLKHTIPPTNKNTERYLHQDNRMILENTDYYYEYCLGGKTGFTDQAGGTLVTWAKKDGATLICVVMNARSNAQNYTDSISLYNYCFDNYKTVKPLADYSFTQQDEEAAQDYLNEYYSAKNLGTMSLSIDKDYSLMLAADSSEKLTTELKLSEQHIAENIIGYVSVGGENGTYYEAPVYFSGYISSKDNEAIEDAVAAGLIEDPNKKKEKKNTLLTVVIVLLAIAAICAGALYLKLLQVRKKRREYLKRREAARRNFHP